MQSSTDKQSVVECYMSRNNVELDPNADRTKGRAGAVQYIYLNNVANKPDPEIQKQARSREQTKQNRL